MLPEASQQPTVSVVMITYGHEAFIAQAIRSVFSQKTSFPFELIISNDHSPDRTDEVIRELLSENHYNCEVRYINRASNLGMNRNFMQTLLQAKGNYIALLEGDDYWTDAFKLQKQIDYLEQHTDCSGTFHLTQTVDVSGKVTGWFRPGYPAHRFTTVDTFRLNVLFHTSSFVYRNRDYKITEDMVALPGLDMMLFSVVAEQGYLALLPEVMSAYRLHGGGITSTNLNSQEKYHTNRIRIFELLDAFFQRKYHKKINRIIGMHQRMLKGKHPYTVSYRIQLKLKKLFGIKVQE